MADTNQVLDLAAIIREVDGNHSKGAAALAESILDHPDFRAALAKADEPAVPEGREPAAVTAKPSNEDSTVMEIIELSSEIEAAGLGQVDFARAVLARWGNPAPAPRADGEVAELVAWLRETGDTIQPSHLAEHQRYKRAAELLQRQVPVPVSERLPEPEDCDAEGRCWWLALHQSWPCLYLMKADIALAAAVATHWLPAHALPLPEVGE